MQDYSIERSEHFTVVAPLHHKHTLLWIHGLNQPHDLHMGQVIKALQHHISQTKIIIPQAPVRFVTCMNAEASSWFDVKWRSEKSFIVPFDEAFSTAEVLDSFDTYLPSHIVF
jgi:3-deoxy-D-manno-octulosonic-acid transferase